MTAEALPLPASGTARWIGFAALCLGMFMAVLDIQIVVTSLKVIEEALGIGADRMSWVQTAYLIAEVIAIPLTGLLTRVFSLRWLVTGAITLFTLASIGCAASDGFTMLIGFRIVQGLAGGILIPAVFSAVFLLFRPGSEQTVATTMAGVIAVLAPASGPVVGGIITESFSWHWLFLINVAPGVAAAAAAALFLPRQPARPGLLARLDWLSLGFIAVALASLEIGLKEAPNRGWLTPLPLGLGAAFVLLAIFAIRRPAGVVEFALLRDRHLAFGSGLSFLLGMGLYGSVYLLPVFLSFVRHMGPIDVGLTVLVTGVAQLISAPIAVWLDRRHGARLLAGIGFSLFAAGLAMSGFETAQSGFGELFWGQVVRGAAIGLCILPVTRFALGLLPLEKVNDASGLYNLSRNLGGAIGIAVIDTVIFTLSPEFAARITDGLTADPAGTARLLGISPEELPDPDDPLGLMGIMDLIQEAALTQAINEAWLLLSALTLVGLALIWRLGPIRVAADHPLMAGRRRF